MNRDDHNLCAQCRDWPLIPREGSAAPTGQRICDLMHESRAWDSRACPVFTEDRADSRRRAAFIEKHSKGEAIGESGKVERTAGE